MLDVSDKFTGFTAILTDISEHRRAEEILRALSLRDDLTGLNNRRGFLAFARRQVVLAERLGAPVRIVYMDVDNMKAINDRHGHGAGDTALRDVAGLLVESFRATDVLGRIGGDEFAALVMGDDEDLRVVERFECNLARFNRYGTRPYCLEVSTGFAEPRAAAECDIAALLDQADGRMYEDKHRRRLHGASRQATFRV
jgi:diguanylate cyclase (GGDEF)-like protein